jgi:hypothetical protein
MPRSHIQCRDQTFLVLQSYDFFQARRCITFHLLFLFPRFMNRGSTISRWRRDVGRLTSPLIRNSVGSIICGLERKNILSADYADRNRSVHGVYGRAPVRCVQDHRIGQDHRMRQDETG